MGGVGRCLQLLKAALLVIAVSYSGSWYLKRLGEVNGLAGAVAFLGFLGLSLLALAGAAYCRILVVRILFALLLTTSAVATESYRAITDEFFSYEAFVTLVEAAAFFDDAALQFGNEMMLAGFIGVALFLGIVLPPRISWLEGRRATLVCAFVPLVVILLLSVTVYVRGGAGSKGLPSCIVGIPYLFLRTADYIEFAGGDRHPVEIQHTGVPPPHDIVLIVDESVRGDYLDINGAEGVVSGLMRDDGAVHNFGLAASATNCSAGSNVILRFGGTRDNWRRAMHTWPSIWAYAKNAGMRTVYLDAQRTGGRLQNYMYADEAAEIDEFLQFGETDVLQRDMLIAKRIAELSNNAASELVVANKIGAHFPVADKFPDDHLVFQPVLPRGDFVGISDMGDKSGFGGNWMLYTNSYRNTILWNLGQFFNLIFEEADLERTLLIYTSDHGQDFHEDGRPGLAFHCSNSPAPTEGLVPMVVVTRLEHWAETARLWSEWNHHNTSHYNIFATLLNTMGYDADEVHAQYGNSLFEPTEDPMTFIAGFDRFGREPHWFQASPPDGR